MTERQKKDSLIAALITLLFMGLTVLTLFTCGLHFDGMELAGAATPEIALVPDEDEQLIEPELLRDLGEPDAVNHDAPAPAVKGEPKPAEEDNVRKVEPGKNPKPAPPEPKKVDSRKPSEVKSTTPSVTDEERKAVTSKMAKGFEGKNGVKDGKSGTSGAGGTGTGISGVASGRVFKGCPKPRVTLRHKVTVVVSVTIDAEGNVTSARAKGGAPADIRRACETAARSARWSSKPDVPVTNGTITFTITPV